MADLPSGPILHFGTTAQRTALSSTALSEGQLAYDQQTNQHYRWDGTAWDIVMGEGFEEVQVGGNTGTAVTLVMSGDVGAVKTYTVTGNCTFTMPSGLTSGVAISFTLILTDSGGPRNITFTGVLWPGGADPTAMSAASAVDIFTFFTINGGTTWYGFTSGTGMAT